MKNLFLIILSVLIGSCYCLKTEHLSSYETNNLPMTSLFEKTVFVTANQKTRGYSGTGFVVRVDNGSYIITVNHIFSLSESAAVGEAACIYKYNDIKKVRCIPANVLLADVYYDIVLLYTEEVLPSFGKLSKNINIGQNVLISGFPMDMVNAAQYWLQKTVYSSISLFRAYVVSYLVDSYGYTEFFRISEQLNYGLSGSPVFDYNGNVLGIIRFFDVGEPQMKYGIHPYFYFTPTSKIINFLDDSKYWYLLESK